MKKGLVVQGRKKKKNLRVLVISAHPDDVDFGCAGTLAAWAREGAGIFYAICTSGEKGTDNPAMSPLRLARMREKEQRAAARVVGAEEVAFLRKPDGELEYSLEFRGDLVRVIRRFRPHIVFTHDPANRAYDNQYIFHADHRLVGELAFDAVYPAALNRNYYPEHFAEGFGPHAVSEIYFFAAAQPNIWVNIEATFEQKLKALACHRSQIKEPKVMGQMIRSWFAEWGREKGMAYAERFRRLKIFHDPRQRLRELSKTRRSPSGRS
jgi:LmbE family N-acetylglucosaminyl deacetylase